MAPIRCLHIDAFTDRPFSGNPAAVCLLEKPRDTAWMQAVAAEMNLSETAFVVPSGDDYDLRWFTPAIEVDLCGHATLASAHALWSLNIVARDRSLRFRTKSGVLTCVQRDYLIEMDFPATPPLAAEPPEGLLRALGIDAPVYAGQSAYDKFVLIDSAQTVRSLEPDFALLRRLRTRGVIVTSPSDDPRYDFISRYFAPAAGIDEDPVTGSAHCCLGPLWSERLGKTALVAFQASPRGGVVHVTVAGDRVVLGGQAVTVVAGELVHD